MTEGHPQGYYGIGVGSAEAEWPTGADLYATNIHQHHGSLQSMHHKNNALHAPPELHTQPPPSDTLTHPSTEGSTMKTAHHGKRGGRKASKTATQALTSDAGSMEVIICQGPATQLPKARGDVERRYICNGQPIHRVTFWRHRKHGCPHVVGVEGHGSEGFTPAPPKPRKPRAGKMDKLVAAADETEQTQFEQPGEPGFASSNEMGMKFKSMGVPYPIVDVDLSHTPAAYHYNMQTGFDVTPGAIPTQLDASSLGPQMPAFSGAPVQGASHQYHFMPRANTNSSAPPIPPFSLLTDALNLYYAPYRSNELEDEEISSPVRTNYVHHSSPLDGRSEASDFMEDPHPANHLSESDGMFKNYLEKNE